MKDTLTHIALGADDHARFRVSTDIVIFKILDDALQVLLRRRAVESPGLALWALPGDYVNASESLEECAGRALAGQTGIRDVYLEQLYSFGQPDRNPTSREISVAYFALVAGGRAAREPDQHGKWWPVDALPELYLDHDRIVQAARDRLAAKLEYSTIAFQLMPEYFTLSELQQVYEAICDKPVDKRNFRKRVLALDHLESTEKMRRNGSHRPARLYRYAARDAIHYLK